MRLNMLYSHEDEFSSLAKKKEICSFTVQKIQDTRIMWLAGIFNIFCKLCKRDITQISLF